MRLLLSQNQVIIFTRETPPNRNWTPEVQHIVGPTVLGNVVTYPP
jgi:hypothetical protein